MLSPIPSYFFGLGALGGNSKITLKLRIKFCKTTTRPTLCCMAQNLGQESTKMCENKHNKDRYVMINM